MLKILINGRTFCNQSNKVISKMKYLNVAEKNDAAKNIANQLSNGASQRVKSNTFEMAKFIEIFNVSRAKVYQNSTKSTSSLQMSEVDKLT